MGGDAAPRMVISGANIARRRYPQVDYLIFGREAEVVPLLNRKAIEGLSSAPTTSSV